VKARLKSEIWVKATVKRLNHELITTMVIKSGDPDAGDIYIKVNFLNGYSRIFSRTFGEKGEHVWLATTGDSNVIESSANNYLKKQVQFDPDCWIIEIEDPRSNFCITDI